MSSVEWQGQQNKVARGMLVGVIGLVTAAAVYLAWYVPALVHGLASAFSRRPAAPVPRSLTAAFVVFAAAAMVSGLLLLCSSRWSRAGVLAWCLAGTVAQLAAYSYFSRAGVEGVGGVICGWLACGCVLLFLTRRVTNPQAGAGGLIPRGLGTPRLDGRL